MKRVEIDTFEVTNMTILCRKCNNYVYLKDLEDHRILHNALELYSYDVQSKPATEFELCKKRRSLVRDLNNNVQIGSSSHHKRLAKIDLAFQVIKSCINGRLCQTDSAFIQQPKVLIKSLAGGPCKNGHVLGISESANEKWKSCMENAYSYSLECDEEIVFISLFDGYGGETAAKQCAMHFHPILKKSVCCCSCFDNKYDEIRQCKHFESFKIAFNEMDGVLLHGADEASRNRWSGCSATTCLLTKSTLHVANVGNVKAILIKTDESFEILTEDHTPRNQKEKKRIKFSGDICKWSKTAWVNGVAMTTRGLGNHGDPILKSSIINTPAVSCIKLSWSQIILLASSGFWHIFDENEALQLIKLWLEIAENHLISNLLSTSCFESFEFSKDLKDISLLEKQRKKDQEMIFEKLESIFHGLQDKDIVAKEISKFLIRAALTAGSKENVTIVIILPYIKKDTCI